MDQNQRIISREHILKETYYYINYYSSNDEYDSIIPLDIFVTEILRRSYTTFFTLQMVNIYLYRVLTIEELKKEKFNICRRKLFIGILIIATKIRFDKNYKNKAWVGVIGGLNIDEINRIERDIMKKMEYDLYVDINQFNLFLSNKFFE